MAWWVELQGVYLFNIGGGLALASLALWDYSGSPLWAVPAIGGIALVVTGRKLEQKAKDIRALKKSANK